MDLEVRLRSGSPNQNQFPYYDADSLKVPGPEQYPVLEELQDEECLESLDEVFQSPLPQFFSYFIEEAQSSTVSKWRRDIDGPWTRLNANYPLLRYLHIRQLYDLLRMFGDSVYTLRDTTQGKFSVADSCADSGLGVSTYTTTASLATEGDPETSLGGLLDLFDSLSLPPAKWRNKRSITSRERFLGGVVETYSHLSCTESDNVSTESDILIAHPAAMELGAPRSGVGIRLMPRHEFQESYTGVNLAAPELADLTMRSWGLLPVPIQNTQSESINVSRWSGPTTWILAQASGQPAPRNTSGGAQPTLSTKKRRGVNGSSAFNNSVNEEEGRDGEDEHNRPFKQQRKGSDETTIRGKLFACCFGRTGITEFKECQERSFGTLTLLRKHIKARHQIWFPRGTRVIENRDTRTWKDIFKKCLPFWTDHWSIPSPYYNDPPLGIEPTLLRNFYDMTVQQLNISAPRVLAPHIIAPQSISPMIGPYNSGAGNPTGNGFGEASFRSPTGQISELSGFTAQANPHTGEVTTALISQPINASVQHHSQRMAPTLSILSPRPYSVPTPIWPNIAEIPNRHMIPTAHTTPSRQIQAIAPIFRQDFLQQQHHLAGAQPSNLGNFCAPSQNGMTQFSSQANPVWSDRNTEAEMASRPGRNLILAIERYYWGPESQGKETWGPKLNVYQNESHMRACVEEHLRQQFRSPPFNWDDFYLVEPKDETDFILDINSLISHVTLHPTRIVRLFVVPGNVLWVAPE